LLANFAGSVAASCDPLAGFAISGELQPKKKKKDLPQTFSTNYQ
jgi:hypothetical protein